MSCAAGRGSRRSTSVLLGWHWQCCSVGTAYVHALISYKFIQPIWPEFQKRFSCQMLAASALPLHWVNVPTNELCSWKGKQTIDIGLTRLALAVLLCCDCICTCTNIRQSDLASLARISKTLQLPDGGSLCITFTLGKCTNE